MTDDSPQPGQTEFTAEQEQQMRQGRARAQAALRASVQRGIDVNGPRESQLADQLAAQSLANRVQKPSLQSFPTSDN